MTRRIPLLILAGAIAEIASIIWVGRALGIIPTLVLLFAGGAIGIRLLKSAGSSVMKTLRQPVEASSPLWSAGGLAASRVVAGLLFLIPGFFSDILALLVLLPPVQRWVGSHFQVKTFAAGTAKSNDWSRREEFGAVIEGEAVEIVAEVEGPPIPGKRTA